MPGEEVPTAGLGRMGVDVVFGTGGEAEVAHFASFQTQTQTQWEKMNDL